MQKFHERVSEYIRAAQVYAKFWAAVAGGVLIVITGQVPLPEGWQEGITVVLAIVTAFSVYQFPNAPVDSTQVK